MENQVDTGNQNNQQVENKPVDSPPKREGKSKTNFIILIVVVVVCFFVFGFGGYFLGKQSSQYSAENKQLETVITPTSVQEESDDSWRTFQNDDVTFTYPSLWTEKPILIRGSGYTQEFNDQQNKYILTFSTFGNYNQVTGKPYTNIDEYINMPYKVKMVTVDGQDGRQALPRAGSENIISVSFFSRDSKFIYTLELQTGNTPVDTNEADIKEGQQLFDQILSSFKFKTQYTDLGELKTAEVIVQDGSYYGPPFDPELYQLEIGQSNHIFAKSDTINLKQYLGKRIKVKYREVKGIVMGEQQLVVVYSVEY